MKTAANSFSWPELCNKRQSLRVTYKSNFYNSTMLYKDTGTLHALKTNLQQTIMSDAGTRLPLVGGGCKHDAQNTTI